MLDLNHVAWPLLSLALSLDQKKVNGKLRFCGFRSPKARAACKEWLHEIESQPDQPGLLTTERLLAAIVNKICRDDLAEAYSKFIETCRISTVASDKAAAEAEKGRARLAAQKAERAKAKAAREAKKQEEEAADELAMYEAARKLYDTPAEDWRRRYRRNPWGSATIIREVP